jgi:hypothetical protein
MIKGSILFSTQYISDSSRGRCVREGTMKAAKKFQADIPSRDEQTLTYLMDILEVRSNADFLTKAVALFRWAVEERKKGCKIFTMSPLGEQRELVMPELERIAPELDLPFRSVGWHVDELENFAELASKKQPQPTEHLIRAMARK